LGSGFLGSGFWGLGFVGSGLCVVGFRGPGGVGGRALWGRVVCGGGGEAVAARGDADGVLLAGRRARQTIEGVREGEPLPPDLLAGGRGVIPFVVPYEMNGRRERLVQHPHPVGEYPAGPPMPGASAIVV